MAQDAELVFPKIEEKPSVISISGLFMVIASALVVGLTILTALIGATKRSQVSSLTRKNQELDAQLRSPELATVRSQLEGATAVAGQLKQILESRTDWRALFEAVNRATVKSVRVTSLSYDGKGNLRVDGEAGDFTSIAKQMAAFRALKIVKSVTVSSISTSINKTNFSLTVELKTSELKFIGGRQQ
ncbi:MAG: PilN domain-containing protein [Patescibacteria group bacterium]